MVKNKLLVSEKSHFLIGDKNITGCATTYAMLEASAGTRQQGWCHLVKLSSSKVHRTATYHEHISNALCFKKGPQDATSSDCCCLYPWHCGILCIVKPHY